MTRAMSLRMRLTLVILMPLFCIAVLIGIWAVFDAQKRAADGFDKSLLSTSLAISRDVAVSGGDALSPQTTDLLRDTSGGLVYYHVFAPDGVFVTGYATPPVHPGPTQVPEDELDYYEAKHQGRPVRALRFKDQMETDGLSGEFTFTVWQDIALRDAAVRDLSWRAFRIMAAMMAGLALIVWFGVRVGLRPLIGLQNAIAQRSSDELTPIKRQVPAEVRGIVSTLNSLLGQVSTSMQAKDDFISNAAHQLRNPIAGVLAMSEAVHSAKTTEDIKERSAELVVAATRASDLANKLLTHERARGLDPEASFGPVDLASLLTEITSEQAARSAAAGVALKLETDGSSKSFNGDAVLLQEAILNLIDNALLHGGAKLNAITLKHATNGDQTSIDVSDNGVGIAPENIDAAVERFSQIQPAGGSGLGLAIAQAVVDAHGGKLKLISDGAGLTVRLTFQTTSGQDV